jgi:hypothetical protein
MAHGYLLEVGGPPEEQQAHWLADPPPRTLAEVIDAAQQTSGVHLCPGPSVTSMR